MYELPPLPPFNTQQAEAAKAITQWYRFQGYRHSSSTPPPKQYFFLSGYAGTGKTFMTYHIITHPQYLNLKIPTITQYRAAEKAYRNRPTDLDPNDSRRYPPSYPTMFAAFTAKAAQVMQSKGIPGSTIHSLLYYPTQDLELIATLESLLESKTKPADSTASPPTPARPFSPDELRALEQQLKEAKQPKFIFIHPSDPRSRLRNTKLLVLDECSMIGAELWADLLATNIPLLILGDLGQLPPVKSASAPFALEPPDYQLTEIVRQAYDNPIIQFATLARTSQLINYSRVLSPRHSPTTPQLASRIPLKQFEAQHLTKNDLTWFDQIICATHRRRQYLNRLYRTLTLPHPHGPAAASSLPVFPQVGEKIICGENDHSAQIYNGVIYIVTDIDPASYETALDAQISPINPVDPPIRFQPVIPADPNDPFGSSQDPAYFKTRQPSRVSFQLAQLDPNAPPGTPLTEAVDRSTATWVRAPVAPFLGYNDTNFIPSNDFEFDYGYAITVHKSQGSQWSKVLIWNERMNSQQTSEDYAKWLYTAITRASDCVVMAG